MIIGRITCQNIIFMIHISTFFFFVESLNLIHLILNVIFMLVILFFMILWSAKNRKTKIYSDIDIDKIIHERGIPGQRSGVITVCGYRRLVEGKNTHQLFFRINLINCRV